MIELAAWIESVSYTHLEAFNFNVVEIDGHDFDQIADAFKQAKECKGKPTAIIMKTIKGKGVSLSLIHI